MPRPVRFLFGHAAIGLAVPAVLLGGAMLPGGPVSAPGSVGAMPLLWLILAGAYAHWAAAVASRDRGVWMQGQPVPPPARVRRR